MYSAARGISSCQGRSRVARVQDAPPGALGGEPDQLGEVVNRDRMEPALTPVSQHDRATLVQRALDKVPLTGPGGPRPVDRTGPKQGRRQLVLTEQYLL